MLVRHKVADFAKWKPVYDAHLSARQKAGLNEEHIFRNADDPNEVLLLFSMEDLDKAKASAPGHGEGRSKREAGRLFSQIATSSRSTTVKLASFRSGETQSATTPIHQQDVVTGSGNY
ncbi:MAG: hypothetical protein DME99_05075 [Verrucomicrobia bacterium]|nr:MAG: hypothetical protein DME99_05075 [Verrucomicrobiota bacterium]